MLLVLILSRWISFSEVEDILLLGFNTKLGHFLSALFCVPKLGYLFYFLILNVLLVEYYNLFISSLIISNLGGV